MTLMNLPSVVRVWVGPWEDERQNLRMPGYMMVKAKDWSWSIGENYESFQDTSIYSEQMSSKGGIGSSQSRRRNNVKTQQPPIGRVDKLQ